MAACAADAPAWGMPLCGGILRNALEGNGEGKGKGEGLGLWDKIFVALRARGLFRCSLFGPPARRAADGDLLGAAAPPRPPLHSPRNTPLGFPYSANPQAPYVLTPGKPVGLSNDLGPARAARLLLRELPSLRSGDLPAHRAIPSTTLALAGCCSNQRSSGCGVIQQRDWLLPWLFDIWRCSDQRTSGCLA